MHKTTVYLPDELKRRIARVAGERGVSVAELIRTALDQHTSGEPPRPTLPLFEGRGDPIVDWDEAMRGFGER